MYPISEDVKKLFFDEYRQTIDITFTNDTDTIKLTEKDILAGSFSINRYCQSGDHIEIGSAIASEVSFTLENADGRFDKIRFEGAEMLIRVGIKKWDAHRWENAVMHYIPLGYFTVDEVPKKGRTISINALDRMVQLDRTVHPPHLNLPCTASALLSRICSLCSVYLETPAGSITNGGILISNVPDDDNLTYRQLLAWIAELSGNCAYVDWNGRMRVEWYHKTGLTLTPSLRFDSYLDENAVTVTGVELTTKSDGANEPKKIVKGTSDYRICIDGNGLITNSISFTSILYDLYDKLAGFSYLPFSASVKPMPFLYPLDMVVYKKADGTEHDVIITNITYTLNGRTELEGKGKSKESSGYAAINPLTHREQVIIDKLKGEQQRDLNSREQALLSLNETITNSLGLRTTEVTDDSGGRVTYFHDGVTLEDSTIIYTMRSGGFAWTNEWQGEDTVWQYGFTRDGNAVINILSAYKIQAEQIDVSYTNGINQSFQAGLGQLDSRITDVSQSLMNETARSTAAEYSMTTKINQNAYSITTEVSRAQDEELAIRSTIAQTADEILASVRNGSSEGFYYRLLDSEFSVGQIIGTDIQSPVLSVNKFGASLTNATIGNCTISENCTIKGTLTANQIHSGQLSDWLGNTYSGSISFNLVDFGNSSIGANYAEYRFESHGSTGSQGIISITSGGMINISGSQGVNLSAGNMGMLNGNWVNDSGQTIVSDPDCKNSISELTGDYDVLFDNLRPVLYKYNDGTSGRIHTGFIATEVQQAIAKAGLTEQDFAAVCTLPYKHPASVSEKETTVCIRYDEIIALNTRQVQKLKQDLASLKSKLGVI